jgi:hypothetical protein
MSPMDRLHLVCGIDALQREKANPTALSHRSGVVPDIQNSEVSVLNSADFLKLGVSDAFVSDETNRNLR